MLTLAGFEIPEEKVVAWQLIMATENHLLVDINPDIVLHSAIVRADLHALADPLQTFYNFNKIMKESMAIYHIDEYEFAKNSEMFMKGLYNRVLSNSIVDSKHQVFYEDVLRGIASTIDLSRILRGL